MFANVTGRDEGMIFEILRKKAINDNVDNVDNVDKVDNVDLGTGVETWGPDGDNRQPEEKQVMVDKFGWSIEKHCPLIDDHYQ